MTPRASVVIPFRDVIAYLPAALDSLVAQTERDFEVLVVDDGSTVEHTDALVAPWKDRLNIRFLRRAPAGVSAARNAAVREAQGEYVAFLDADDAWLPDKLASQLARFGNDAILSYGNVRFIDAAGCPTGKDLKLQVGLAELPSGDCRAALARGNFVMPSTLLMRRADYLDLGGFDEAIGYTEDWELAVRAVARGPFVAHQEPLTLYRRHGASVTLSNKNRAQRQVVADRALALVPAGERDAARAWLSGQDAAEDAFLAISGRRFGAAALHLARAFWTSPGSAAHVVRARVASFAAKRRA